MAFTGKATYSAGASLPEIAEDVSDLVAIVSPFETPLLDALGDPQAEARSTHHEWLEDTLLPNSDLVKTTPAHPLTDEQLEVNNPDRFRVGDQVRCKDSEELLLVKAVGSTTITVTRGYGGTTAGPSPPATRSASWATRRSKVRTPMRPASPSARVAATGRRSSRRPSWSRGANWRSGTSAWPTNWTSSGPRP